MRIPTQVTERVKEAPAQALRAVFSGIGQVLLVADRIKHRAAEPDRPAAVEPPAQPRRPAPVLRDETRWRSLDTTGNVRLLSEDEAARAEPPVARGSLSPETMPVPATETIPARAAETTPVPAAETTPAPADGAAPARAAELVDVAAETPEATGPAVAAEVIEFAVEAVEPAVAAEVFEADETAEAVEPAAAAEAVEPAAAAAQTSPEAPEEPGPAVIRQATLPVPNYDNLTVASLRARLRGLDRSQVQLLRDYEKANAGRAEILTMFERRIVKLDSGGA